MIFDICMLHLANGENASSIQAAALSDLDGQLPVLAAPTEAVSAYGMSKPKMQQVDRAKKY